MRARLWVCVLLTVAAPAAAAPFHPGHESDGPPPRRVLHISGIPESFGGWHRRYRDDFLLPRSHEMSDSAPGGLSLGPVQAQSEMVNGRRRMRYSLEGLDLMGGDVSGSIGTHHAEIFLRWDTH